MEKVIAGADKFEYRDRMLKLHDELAEVNKNISQNEVMIYQEQKLNTELWKSIINGNKKN